MLIILQRIVQIIYFFKCIYICKFANRDLSLALGYISNNTFYEKENKNAEINLYFRERNIAWYMTWKEL